MLAAITRTSSLKSSWNLPVTCGARSLGTSTYVLRVLLTKGCNLSPDPLVRGHDRIPLASQLVLVSDGVS